MKIEAHAGYAGTNSLINEIPPADYLPLRYIGGDLGLVPHPFIGVIDQAGVRKNGVDVEWALRNLHLFTRRCQLSLVMNAALHYDLHPLALMGADFAQWIGNGRDNARHEGPLELLHHLLGISTFTGIAVRSPAGRCAMPLEEVLWRFDQFGEDDQDALMVDLAAHFGFDFRAHRDEGAAS